MIYFIVQCKKIYDEFVKDEITVYAAQASFFIVLSFFPFIMILLTTIQLIPTITQGDLLLVISRLFPAKVYPLVESIVTDLYTTAPAAILSVTTIATIWSASRGMLGIERGLNRIIDCNKRRNYVISRLINSGYTVVFILVCIMSLVLMVFGSSLQKLLLRYLPILNRIAPYLLSLRALIALAILIIFFMALYTFLPYEKQTLRHQLPGALFSTGGWIVCSYGFSIYFNHFKRFSYMYGSLAAVVILMLWLYFCICILFLGAEVNRHMKFSRKQKDR
ncbi:YihY/virulence factor BrkB family protein [[Clostridium] symbiosum]|uniref:YihY/virulence factor BrkB family protein n=1 Tax=Clostridium symbiosum TaxID=1512 RepID=UPI001D08D339|nr:YihY/virulence factor BrkB family protein [[Clostridium] symbiosum]MCB6609400.1 YihY/virulence factor BrkB family protein [[Clostridium] symbiosum]MCB6929228.1 YihY/virulence factor BrkB family protein [[Clostridium] symbiosum]